MWIIDEFEKQLEKDIRDDNIRGSISAAIIKDDETIWAKALGPSTLQGDTPATVDTIYRTGAIAFNKWNNGLIGNR